ncbi:acyl carrier protein [Halpernia sp. GG3]
MTKEQFCEKLKEELGEISSISPETDFKNLESYGSLSAVLVLQLIENQFDIKLNPRSFRSLKTVNDIAESVGSDKLS